jgi:epoxyqueuosine reductase
MESMELKEEIRRAALDAGFVRARILAPFEPASPVIRPPAETSSKAGPGRLVPDNYRFGSPSLLVTALPYGNQDGETPDAERMPPGTGSIALFARRNYYREAVRRLQVLAVEFRKKYDGSRSDYRIFCNSPAPEKPAARACGLGALGRNSLIITPEAGSLVIIAAMTLPVKLEMDRPLTAAEAAGEDCGMDETFPFCGACGREQPPCKAACPTGAIRGDGKVDTEKCIQWYASGNGATVPPDLVRHWGRRLYGCTECQDACARNRKPIPGVRTNEGPLPAYMDCRELAAAPDGELKARFKGTAMGLSWLGPEGIRRNARLAGQQAAGQQATGQQATWQQAAGQQGGGHTPGQERE